MSRIDFENIPESSLEHAEAKARWEQIKLMVNESRVRQGYNPIQIQDLDSHIDSWAPLFCDVPLDELTIVVQRGLERGFREAREFRSYWVSRYQIPRLNAQEAEQREVQAKQAEEAAEEQGPGARLLRRIGQEFGWAVPSP